MGNIQWLNIEDESYLLADNNGWTYSNRESNRPPTPTVFFQKNTSRVEERFQNDLIALSLYLITHPKEKVKLSGSCDALGDALSNERLAWERAFAVQGFLMAHGALMSQIDVEISIPHYSGKNERDRKVDISFE
jgi:outer membrane protein OmpA-like peptidoglycan-associated protein